MWHLMEVHRDLMQTHHLSRHFKVFKVRHFSRFNQLVLLSSGSEEAEVSSNGQESIQDSYDDCDGEYGSDPNYVLFKIEPILLHLNQKFQAMYTMDQNIALDESLMQWKGWLNISQFISNKAAKVGVKTYELCESQTGYLWRFDVHAKKHMSRDQNNPLDASTPSIVLDLLRGLEGYGYTVWMDNYYNSPALARQLKGFGFDVVGTLRTNRQFVPQELTALTKNNMKKGDIAGYTSGDVDV